MCCLFSSFKKEYCFDYNSWFSDTFSTVCMQGLWTWERSPAVQLNTLNFSILGPFLFVALLFIALNVCVGGTVSRYREEAQPLLCSIINVYSVLKSGNASPLFLEYLFSLDAEMYAFLFHE